MTGDGHALPASQPYNPRFVFATIQTGRALLREVENTTINFSDDRSVTWLMHHLDKADFFRPDDISALDHIASQARARITDVYPALKDHLEAGCFPQDRLGDPDAEHARKLLEAAIDFRRLRQRVFDEIQTDRLLSELRLRR